ncbi:DUF861 domain-containing protein (plasmid) [Rhodococcus rhodochrous]|uniref:cupin domain-containing protein n=1 Tax=Rhodococcus rhodochrous TaxID=1829 RepID=UPI00132F2226|nr:cupin domain-containing protein [Rhodococcus rhodochrous]QHG85510.1 DUF861 domain-containing protein [Rhodococcus rhodochrous]
MSTVETTWTAFVPVAEERLREGSPTTRISEQASEEGYSIGLWEATAGRFATAPHDGFWEVIHILQGRGTLRSADGSTIDLFPGASFVLGDGFVGEWQIDETIRKFYALIDGSPAAQ